MSDSGAVLAAIVGLAERFGGIERRFDGLESRFDSLERRFDALETRFDALETRFDALETRFDALEGRFDALEGRVDGLASELTRLRVEVIDRLDRQQDVLSRIKDDITVNVAATDYVRKQQATTRADYDQLANQLSVVHRRLIQMEQRLDQEHRS